MAAKISYSKGSGSCKAGAFVFVLAATLFLCSSYVLAADSVRNKSSGTSNGTEMGANSVPPRYRVFTLRHIPAEQGKKYLAEARIGTVSQLPGLNALLVTAQRGELIKASAILKLVDAKEPFVIKAFFPPWGVKNLPSNEQIAAKVGNISIGTFSEPPALAASFLRGKTARAAKSKAIIDIHNDAVIAVAPARELEKIVTAIEELQKGKAPPSADVSLPRKGEPVEPNQINELKAEPALRVSLLSMAGSEAELDGIAAPASAGVVGEAEAGESESDELFDRLLGSLAEAEKKMGESRQVETEPNEPVTVVIVPGPNEPNEPSVGPEQPKEPDFLAAVLERLNALEAAVKEGPEPQREPQPPEEQVAVKIEKSGEVVEPVSKVRSYEPELIADGNEMLVLNLPPKLNIIQLLELAGMYLHLDYMYDPADVAGLKGEVTLKIQGTVRVKDLYPLLESVLRFKGFVMTRRPGSNLVIVVPQAKAVQLDTSLEPEKGRIGDVIITGVFKLKHIDTASAQNLLKSMNLGISITAIPEAETLFVTGYAYRMARIEKLLEMFDKPGEPKQFRFRQLKYTMANTLASKIKTLAEELGTISISIGASTAARPPSVSPPRGETSAQRRAREMREAAARAAAARARITTAARPAAAKPTVYLDADERTNRILMIGLAKQLAVVDELIDTLDVEKPDPRTLRLYEIQHVGAEEVMNKLGELGITGGGQVSARGSTRTSARPVPPTTRTTTSRPSVTTRTGTTGEALVEEPQVVIIESTNSLLVNATAEQHAQVAMIIAYVDSEIEQGVIPYVIYPLENQDPEELGTTLNKLVMETTTTQSKDAKIVTTTKKLEEDIYIIPDPKTYSLIVYASKKNQQWISSLIEQLDEYRAQVLIDVTLVEITKNEEFALDLDLVSKFPRLAAGAAMSGIGPPALISPFPAERIIEAGSLLGAGTAFYADTHIQALIDMMHEKGYGRVLARPKLLVNDNQEGSIKTEEQTSVAQERTDIIPGSAATSPTSVTTVAFTSYTAGITLTIKPHISKGDQLQLEIALTRSDFRLRAPTTLKGSEYPTPPDLLTSDVQTIVTVPDKTTIILGGLERLKQSKGGAKVPILGYIPLIGGLFRKIENTDTQSRLYVFVKANILRPGEEAAAASDIEIVSAKNRATFEKYEKEMQDYEDWPGIKSKPMDPVKILEADEESGGQRIEKTGRQKLNTIR